MGTRYVAEPLGIGLCAWLSPEFPENILALYQRLRMGVGSGGTGEGTP